jgi:phosphopantothenoylcysteine decarboxylase/phosphopantothenate--cysteine ligase
VALAAALREVGAEVTLVAANVGLEAPPGVRRVDVGSAEELRAAVLEAQGGAAAVVMAAAVADFRPAQASEAKIKRGGRERLLLDLVRTPDVLAEVLGARADGQVVVAFAAETGAGDGEVLAAGRDKARAKGADLTVVNRVGPGVGIATATNRVWICDAGGEVVGQAAGSKLDVARAIVSAVSARVP